MPFLSSALTILWSTCCRLKDLTTEAVPGRTSVDNHLLDAALSRRSCRCISLLFQLHKLMCHRLAARRSSLPRLSLGKRACAFDPPRIAQGPLHRIPGAGLFAAVLRPRSGREAGAKGATDAAQRSSPAAAAAAGIARVATVGLFCRRTSGLRFRGGRVEGGANLVERKVR